jgi:hypothetical protein
MSPIIKTHKVAPTPEPTVRVLAAEKKYTNPKILNARQTLATKLLGQKMGGLVFNVIKMTAATSALFFLMSVVVGLLCMFGVLPSWAGWVSLLLCFPFLSSFWAMANPILVWKLLFNFDVGYPVLIATLAAMGWAQAVRFDGRAAFTFMWWNSTLAVTFFDAAHVSSQKDRIFGLVAGIVGVMIFVPCLFFGIFPDLHSFNIGVSPPVSDGEGSEITVNNIFFVNERLATVVLYLFKHLWNAVMHPDCFSNLKSRIVNEKITVDELQRRQREDMKTSVRRLSTVGSANRTPNPKKKGKKALPGPFPLPSATLPSSALTTASAAAPRNKSVAELELDSLRIGDDEMVRVFMVEEGFAGIMTMDSHHTLAVKLFGKRWGGWAFATISKVELPCGILWLASVVVGILCLFGVMPKSMCLLSFAMGIWLLVTFWLTSSPHLLLRLVTTFDVWYMTANITLALVGLVDIFRGDMRVAFFALWWVNTLTVIWFDAGHVTAKRHCTLGTIVGMVAIMIVTAGLQFGVFPDMNVRTISLTLSNVEVSINNVAFVNERLATVLLFFSKNLYNAVRHPGCYVNLKARLTHGKLSCGDLRKRLQGNAISLKDISSLNPFSKSSRFQSLWRFMPSSGSRRARRYPEGPAKIKNTESKAGGDLSVFPASKVGT